MMRGGRKDEVANLVTPSVTTATIDLAKATASILVTRQPKSDPKMESEQISIARSIVMKMRGGHTGNILMGSKYGSRSSSDERTPFLWAVSLACFSDLL